MIYLNRYDQPACRAYLDLLELVKDKDYFVLTTNVDHLLLTARTLHLRTAMVY